MTLRPGEEAEMDEQKIENLEEVTEVALEVEEPKTEEQLLREAEEAEKAKKAKMKAIWDKVTTGLLIFLMASPILILLWIFMWFINPFGA